MHRHAWGQSVETFVSHVHTHQTVPSTAEAPSNLADKCPLRHGPSVVTDTQSWHMNAGATGAARRAAASSECEACQSSTDSQRPVGHCSPRT